LIALVLSFVLGVEAHLLYLRDAFSLQVYSTILKVGPYVLGFAAAIFIMHYVVRKRFRTFRISLTSIRSSDFGQMLQPTRKRTFRIWWTYTWRTALYVVILSVAANIPMAFILGVAIVVSPALGKIVAQLIQLVFAGAAGLFVIYSNILDEDIADFRVGLVPSETLRSAPPTGEETAAPVTGAPDNVASAR
jgi:hypothetical protein